MNQGYHQLELQENSRDITTFSTHIGLYRYQRLNFGTRSAGEIFQDTVSREIIRDISGCLNISDHILNYSQLELEMLAAEFACRKFHVLLYGSSFKIVTDHKPLEVILNNPRHKTSIRLQRMMVRMLNYEFNVEYAPGKANISDFTSRHPLPREICTKRELGTTKDVKQEVNFVVASDIPRAIRKEELVKATESDEKLQRRGVNRGM